MRKGNIMHTIEVGKLYKENRNLRLGLRGAFVPLGLSHKLARHQSLIYLTLPDALK